jgi:hypothetical protein
MTGIRRKEEERDKKKRELTAIHGPSNSMHIDVASINIKVNPVKDESLTQPKNSFTQEYIDCIASIALKHGPHDRIPKHQGDKGVGTFDSMLNIDGWKELEDTRKIFSESFRL